MEPLGGPGVNREKTQFGRIVERRLHCLYRGMTPIARTHKRLRRRLDPRTSLHGTSR